MADLPIFFSGTYYEYTVLNTWTQVTLVGGEGGYSNGGLAATIAALIPTSPGEILRFYVGGGGRIDGLAAFNGGSIGGQGGGGGATDVRRTPFGLGNRLVVAGGGGGMGGTITTAIGGNGGWPVGGAGSAPYTAGGFSGVAAGAGTQIAGGAAGTANAGPQGTVGSFGQGGTGATNTVGYHGGGGGGGWYGGGGGAGNTAESGGGGSSYVAVGVLLLDYGTQAKIGSGEGANGSALVTQSNAAGWICGRIEWGKGGPLSPTSCGRVYQFNGLYPNAGAPEYLTIPANIHNITAHVWAPGGAHAGGNGAYVKARMPVVPGDVYQINVGGTGYGAGAGWNGGGAGGVPSPTIGNSGGGGGASDIRRGAYTLNDRIITAGGGGGGSENGHYGGAGGYPAGSNAQDMSPSNLGGRGGTQTAGGAGGTKPGGTGVVGVPGGFGYGGSTGSGGFFYQPGGGGGGWYGGGGGTMDFSPSDTGGGGGSSHVDPLYAAQLEANVGGGAVSDTNGLIVIEWDCHPIDTVMTRSVTYDFLGINVAWPDNGTIYTFTVPAGVTLIFVECYGGTGSGGYLTGIQAYGGYMSAYFDVSPGQVIYAYPGAPAGASVGCGWNGAFGHGFYSSWIGSGGGADIRMGGQTFNHRVLVAGGGGAAGELRPSVSGAGRGYIINGGYGGWPSGGYAGVPENVAGPGTQTAGGAPGFVGGTFGVGGTAYGEAQTGGFGFYGGAGGGGWYGGASGGDDCGGGGGSSYFHPTLARSPYWQNNFWSGAGRVRISWP